VSGTGRGFGSAPLKKHKRWQQCHDNLKVKCLDMSSRLFGLTILLTTASLVLTSCDKKEPNLPITDFVKFDYKNIKRAYIFKDSVFQFCERDKLTPSKFQFEIGKTYHSTDDQFHLLTIDIKKLVLACPTNSLENNLDFTFTLTAKNADSKFVDYTNYNINNLSWTQRYNQEKIILTGDFKGWLYKYFPVRVTGLQIISEPVKLDSIYVDNGSFQLTLK